MRVVIAALLAAVVLYAMWLKDHMPKGAPALSSIELSFTSGEFATAIQGWVTRPDDREHLVMADQLTFFRRWVMGSDFLFIPTYVLLLALSYVRLERSVPRSPLIAIVAVCAFAGVLDVFENVGILWLTGGIGGRHVSAGLFPEGIVLATSVISALKWAAITLAAVFIGLALFSGDRGRVLLLCRYSLLSVALGTVPLIVTSQGQDLVAALAETRGREHQAFFLLALSIWGLSVWYWSRVLLDTQAPIGAHVHLRRALPRALGFVTLLAPVYPLWLADARLLKKVALIGGCVSLALLFGVFVVLRRRWMTARGAVPSRLVTSTPAFRIAAVSAVVSASLFIALVTYPVSVGNAVGAIGILFIAAANTVFLGSAAVLVSRLSGIAVEAVAFACAAVFSFWNDNHDVTVKAAALPPPIQQVFTTWAADLKARHSAHATPMPVFLIAAEGGGIRAAYWTGTVLGALNDAAPNEFPQHVFAINGISGGSLGAALYANLRQDVPGGTGLREAARQVFADGYLAPALSRLVTGDLLQWFIPIPVHAFDRSTAIEDAFASAYNTRHAGQDRFHAPFLDLKPSAAAGVPALVLAATDVEEGSRIVTAPFSWTAADLPDVLDYHRRTGGDPTLVAAVHNSARFTYVSPAGLVRTVDGAGSDHVIDGGYFDPSGVETLADLTRVLAPLAAQEGMEIVPIYITNSFGSPSQGTAAEDAYGGQFRPVEILGELFAPVRGLVRGRNAHARTAQLRISATYSLITFAFCQPSEQKAKGTAKRMEPPLGWELSEKTRDRMDAFWNACVANDALKPVLDRLGVSP
jgi:hypothetical protein